MMNMNNLPLLKNYFSIVHLRITFQLEREKLNSMMLRFPPQISNWMWSGSSKAHFKTTLLLLFQTNPLLRSSSYAYLFSDAENWLPRFHGSIFRSSLNTVQLSWLSIFWLRKNLILSPQSRDFFVQSKRHYPSQIKQYESNSCTQVVLLL